MACTTNSGRATAYTERRSSDALLFGGLMTVYDPTLLITLLTVAQTGSFTQAAARLGVRQPTVSQHISRLEKQTGRVLILRDTHSVSLTPDGEAMIGFAHSIIAAHEQATAYFSGSRPRGRLRI